MIAVAIISTSHCNYLVWSARYTPTSLHLLDRETFALLSGNFNRLVSLLDLSRYKLSTDPITAKKWDYCFIQRVWCCFSFFSALRQRFIPTLTSSSTWYWVFGNFTPRRPSYSLILETNTRITGVSPKYLPNGSIIIARISFVYRKKDVLITLV